MPVTKATAAAIAAAVSRHDPPNARTQPEVALLVERAKKRCAQHRGPTSGFCHQCFRAELEEHLFVENPGMKRDDVIRLVDEWILADDYPPN